MKKNIKNPIVMGAAQTDTQNKEELPLFIQMVVDLQQFHKTNTYRSTETPLNHIGKR